MTLHVRDIHFSYDGAPLLRGASLTVEAGQSGFLLGPSGEGKSTLLRIIAGLERPTQGTVSWDDELLEGDIHVPAHKRGVGMLFQEPALFPHLDVAGNVAFGLRGKMPRKQEREAAKPWLEMVDLGERAEAAVDELSGGQRQRVALARTLAAQPRVVLLDEPLSALDADLRVKLGGTVKQLLADQGVAALWVTHDEAEAQRLGDRVWRLRDGVSLLA